MPRRRRATAPSPSVFDSLIDAERAALIQAGRRPTRGELVRALMAAADLPARDARRAVAGFIDRRGGFIPTGTPADDARAGWIDDLLDAERARAARDDRPVTPRALVRAVRQASPALPPREARAAVADYLYRRGGRTLGVGRWAVAGLGAVALVAAIALAAWALGR